MKGEWRHGTGHPARRLVGVLRRRHLLMPGILAAHILLLALIFLTASAPVAVPVSATPLNVFDVSGPSQDPAPPVPRPPTQEIPVPVPLVVLEVEGPAAPPPPVFDAAAAQEAGFGTSCDVAETLGKAFMNNEILQAELARIGPAARSVANAIMFWDGGWVDIERGAPEDAVTLLRRAILEGIKAAPPECLTEDLAGPRFISISDATGTTILVLGSGTWRWEQIVSEPLETARESASETTLQP